MFLDEADKDLLKYEISEEVYIETHTNDHDFSVTDGLILHEIGMCFARVNRFGGYVPHFEIISHSGRFKSCIEIFEPKYYFRDDTTFKKLSNKQIDDLIYFLHAKSYQDLSIYSVIYGDWLYLNNGKICKYVDNHHKIPDYNLLKEEN